jgi:hypothetical protein
VLLDEVVSHRIKEKEAYLCNNIVLESIEKCEVLTDGEIVVESTSQPLIRSSIVYSTAGDRVLSLFLDLASVAANITGLPVGGRSSATSSCDAEPVWRPLCPSTVARVAFLTFLGLNLVRVVVS